jgi:hypothetical protein
LQANQQTTMILKRNIIKRLLILAMIPTALLLFQNHLSNWHYHVLSNGIVVKHSHPYNKAENPGNPLSNHKHSEFEHFILAQLSGLSLLIAFALVAFAFIFAIYAVLLLPGFQFHFLRQQYLALQPLRAPPSIF